MKIERIGILHPGAMGTSVAATAQNGGHEIWWVPEGRSRATRDRAGELGFRPAASPGELAECCQVVLSVCPPHAAEDVARSMVAAGFTGLFVDANAISPRRTGQIGARLARDGVDFVDGGIIGTPAWERGTTRLYLTGPRARDAARLFAAGPLEAVCLEGEVGRASALKMCYAANSKGTRALLLAVLGAADALGVREELLAQWEHDRPGLPAEICRKVLGTTPRAWRWVGEMEEIAATFAEAGLPEGFHTASGRIYQKLAEFRHSRGEPTLEEVLRALRAN